MLQLVYEADHQAILEDREAGIIVRVDARERFGDPGPVARAIVNAEAMATLLRGGYSDHDEVHLPIADVRRVLGESA